MKVAQISVEDTGLHGSGEVAYGERPTEDIGTYVGNHVLTPLFSVVGLIFLVLMVYAGIMWMTAAGSPDRVGKAKKILISSVIGLALVLFALAITYWILGAVAFGVSNVGNTL